MEQAAVLTGPTRSGMKITKRPTFVRMKKNPMRVTMFGASHNGNSSTNAFHYSGVNFIATSYWASMAREAGSERRTYGRRM